VSNNADGHALSADGFVFPAFIILERGESLSEWTARVAPDFITSMFVLCHIALRLQVLQAAGFVHRDLKPSNVLWHQTVNAWRLLDFGCAAREGWHAICLC
jgi:serine/threonine protein kinase